MKIRRILNPVAQENTYILENDTACLVIDPGSDTSAILAELKAIDKPVAAILLTHTHYDHIMSVEAVRQAYNHPPVYVAEAEKDWLMSPIVSLKRASPENTVSSLSKIKEAPPIECPGVGTTLN